MRDRWTNPWRILAALLLVAASACGSGDSEKSEPSEVEADGGGSPQGDSSVPSDAPAGTDSSTPVADLPEGEDAQQLAEDAAAPVDLPPPPPGPVVRYEPGATDWLAVGWPSDRSRGADGGVDLSAFPTSNSDLIETYVEHGMEALDGFGLNGSTYFQVLGGPLDPSSFPTPEQSTGPDAAIQLLNVSAGSASFGRRWPVMWRWYQGGRSAFVPEGLLAIRPVLGRPLEEGETHCVLLTTGLRDEAGDAMRVAPELPAELDSAPHLEPLRAWLEQGDLERESIAAATCFTTQNATVELRAVRDFLEAGEAPEVLEVLEPTVAFELHGTYRAPNFQAGEKPYDEDGDLRFDESGAPVVQEDELNRFLLLVPPELTPPAAGWPTVLYAHGTCGDYESCRSTARDLLTEGLAVLCVDQPLHGSRGPGEEPLSCEDLSRYSFNFTNPRAGRMSFRQSAVDTLTLTRMLAAGRFDLSADRTLAGNEVRLDPERIFFFGHSHGGLSGALAVALDPRIKGALLSGAGAGMIHTILLRKDPFDIKKLIRTLLLIPDAELDRFHPVLSLIQMLTDATDPLTYAPYWLDPEEGQQPRHVMLTEGTADHATPAISTDTLAAAGGVPILLPMAKDSLPHRLAGLEPTPAPVEGNVEAGGGTYSAGLVQWQDASHWVAFRRADARDMWATFFRDLRDGRAPRVGHTEMVHPGWAPLAPADACEDALRLDEIPLPLSVRGNTALAADTMSAPGCGLEGSPGAGQRDHAYTFTPDESGRYLFVLETPPKERQKDPPTGPDMLTIAGSCADVVGSCVDSSAKGRLDVALDAGRGYAIIVDGSTPAHRGPYILHAWRECVFEACGDRRCGYAGCTPCGSCPTSAVCTEAGVCEVPADGDRCESAMRVDSIPATLLGDTRPFGDDLELPSGACGGAPRLGGASRDAVYRVPLPQAGAWVFSLEAAFDAALYVVALCGAPESSCLGASRSSRAGERVLLQIDEPRVAYAVVDGASNIYDRAGPFTLRVEACVPDCEGKVCGGDGCGGSCGPCEDQERCVSERTCDPIPYVCTETAACEEALPADRCREAGVVDSLPYTVTGDTEDLYDDLDTRSSPCPRDLTLLGAASKDAVYSYTAEDALLLDVRLEASFDAALYVLEGCGEGQRCLAGSRETSSTRDERIFLPLDAGMTVHVVVDGARYEDDEGGYKLRMRACTPTCDERACGSDGCGGSCGTCGEGEKCKSYQCVPDDPEPCTPDCGGKECGDDGCKGSCGTCLAPKDVCTEEQLCADVATLPGNTCETAFEIPADDLPHTAAGDTGDADNYYAFAHGQCQPWVGKGQASPDEVYSFTAPDDGAYVFDLDSEAFDGALYAVTDCAHIPRACLGAADGTHRDRLELELKAGATVFVIVDGASNEEAQGGEYELRVERRLE